MEKPCTMPLILWKPAVCFPCIKLKLNLQSLQNPTIYELITNSIFHRRKKVFLKHCIKIILCPVDIKLTYSTEKLSSENTENLAYFSSDTLWMPFEDTPSLAITLEMPGSDSEHKEGWTGVLIAFQRPLTEILAKADLIAIEVTFSEPVLEWADTQDLQLQYSWQ